MIVAEFKFIRIAGMLFLLKVINLKFRYFDQVFPHSNPYTCNTFSQNARDSGARRRGMRRRVVRPSTCRGPTARLVGPTYGASGESASRGTRRLCRKFTENGDDGKRKFYKKIWRLWNIFRLHWKNLSA